MSGFRAAQRHVTSISINQTLCRLLLFRFRIHGACEGAGLIRRCSLAEIEKMMAVRQECWKEVEGFTPSRIHVGYVHGFSSGGWHAHESLRTAEKNHTVVVPGPRNDDKARAQGLDDAVRDIDLLQFKSSAEGKEPPI